MPLYFLMMAVCATLLSGEVLAFELPGHARTTVGGASGTATVRAVFTPGDDIAGQIVEAVSRAHRQILVQAFSFTHDDIAQALQEARRRGVEVKLIADREQTEKMDHGLVPALAHGGMQVWLDGDHQSAHNKVMVIDAGTPAAIVITGSFNFTRAAQHKNAENVIFISGNESLVQAYVQNWQRHLAHSKPLTLH